MRAQRIETDVRRCHAAGLRRGPDVRLDGMEDAAMTRKTELAWKKKGFEYLLYVRDGYSFVRGWRKVRVPLRGAGDER
jgi:hypothetical protein